MNAKNGSIGLWINLWLLILFSYIHITTSETVNGMNGPPNIRKCNWLPMLTHLCSISMGNHWLLSKNNTGSNCSPELTLFGPVITFGHATIPWLIGALGLFFVNTYGSNLDIDLRVCHCANIHGRLGLYWATQVTWVDSMCSSREYLCHHAIRYSLIKCDMGGSMI